MMRRILKVGCRKVGNSRVALVRCQSYDRSAVESAVFEALHLLGGLDSILSGGGTCLLKPNILSPSTPEASITTHPEVVRAIAHAAKDVAVEVIAGDSPGRGDTRRAAEVSGIAAACKECSVEVVSFDDEVPVSHPNGRVCKEFILARQVVESSHIINIPKMKTHGLMTYTGAVKNLFGCIPGTLKARMHLRFQSAEEFSLMLLDLIAAVRPAVSVLDAVVAMDGDGPSHGRPRQFGAIIASCDPVAVDAVALLTAGVDPMRVPYLAAASELGIGAVRREDITILGDSIESIGVSDFRLPAGGPSRSVLRFAGAARRSVTAKPVIDESKCTGCAQCQRSCPPQVISISPEKKAVIADGRCIRCYCCHEMCPSGAISLHLGAVARFVDRFLDSMNRR